MRSVTTRIAVLAMTLWLTGNVQAADSQGNYAVWGMGNQSCHAYNKAREQDKTDDFKYYVMGYLTAYNVHQNETYSISSATPMPEIMDWLDKFCDSHQVHSFENAMKNFVHEHYKKRMKTAPSSSSYGR